MKPMTYEEWYALVKKQNGDIHRYSFKALWNMYEDYREALGK